MNRYIAMKTKHAVFPWELKMRKNVINPSDFLARMDQIN